MNDLRTLKIPLITDGVKFEHLCRDIWKNDKSICELVAFNGRPGQSQNGVDVFGRNINTQQWFGIQCKSRSGSNSLSKKEIDTEIEKALAFNPELNHYILATTLKRDVGLQNIAREINDKLSKEQKFTFEILFWNDIEELLKEEQNYNIYYKYYHEFFADNTTLGHSIGKLFNLELGIGDSTDTHYELILGKIPTYKNNDDYNANYYRGAYFIVNLNERKMEIFKLDCHPTDMEMAFRNKLDRYRFAKWINSLENIDDFIYSEEDRSETYLTLEEHKEYCESLDDIT